MRALFIRKLHLWPRFESSAKDALDAVDKDIKVCPLSYQLLLLHASNVSDIALSLEAGMCLVRLNLTLIRKVTCICLACWMQSAVLHDELQIHTDNPVCLICVCINK